MSTLVRNAYISAVEFSDLLNQGFRDTGLTGPVFLLTACCLLPAASFSQIAQIRWDVQQDRPVAHDVAVWQGETVDLMPRLVQGTLPVAVTNAPVEFRYREASLPTNTYRYVAASANTNSGVIAVRWIPDYDAGAAYYDYQVIVGSNAVNPRCFGRITMRPTIGWPASTNAPPPVTLYTTRAELQSSSNALAGAIQALATQRVERVWSPDGTEYRDGTGGVWRAEAVAGGWTLDIHALGLSSPISGLAFPVATNWNGRGSGYSISVAPGGTGYNISVTTGFGDWGATDAQSESPIQLAPISQGENGPATLTYSTNSVNWSHVATVALDTSLTGLATRAELAPYVTGTVLTQQTSHVIAQWYDVTGVVTQQILRVGDSIVTNRFGPRVTLPDGIVTNGMGGLLLATNSTGASFAKISGSGGVWGNALEVDGGIHLSNWGNSYIRFPGGGYVSDGVFYGAGGEMGFKTWLIDNVKWVIRALNGNAYIDNGSLTVAGTNTAAVFVETGTPSWIVMTNIASACTVTNDNMRPARIFAAAGAEASTTGAVSFANLRSDASPIYFTVQGFRELRFPTAYVVGGGSWQTNRVNIFTAWLDGTNTFVSPITTREIY